MFVFRPGTCDYDVYRQVVQCNEYGLPETFQPDDIVLDVGAHIGSFAFACVQRGARHVVAFEPDPENRSLALRNLHDSLGSVVLRREAVWRSDVPVESVGYSGYERDGSAYNTGAGTLLSAEAGMEVGAVALDEVLAEVGGPVRLLKLDCEGSEFPILYTSKRLDRIKEIAGEFHEYDGPYAPRHSVPESARVGDMPFTMEALAAFLEAQGFRVTSGRGRPEPRIGLFSARRPRIDT